MSTSKDWEDSWHSKLIAGRSVEVESEEGIAIQDGDGCIKNLDRRAPSESISESYPQEIDLRCYEEIDFDELLGDEHQRPQDSLNGVLLFTGEQRSTTCVRREFPAEWTACKKHKVLANLEADRKPIFGFELIPKDKRYIYPWAFTRFPCWVR
jgi:hypothetical protein